LLLLFITNKKFYTLFIDNLYQLNKIANNVQLRVDTGLYSYSSISIFISWISELMFAGIAYSYFY
jgi:hypothetical protein